MYYFFNRNKLSIKTCKRDKRLCGVGVGWMRNLLTGFNLYHTDS